MSSLKQIWLVRHAENVREGDLSLSPIGVKQARSVGQRIIMQHDGPDPSPIVIISSPAQRSVQTAHILSDCFSRHGKEIYSAHNPLLAAETDEEIVDLARLIKYFSDACRNENWPEANSIVLVTHKQTSIMQILAATIDPNAYMNPTNDTPLDTDGIKALAEQVSTLSNEEIAAQFGIQDSNATHYDFMEALIFHMKEASWDSFGFDCGKLIQRLACTM